MLPLAALSARLAARHGARPALTSSGGALHLTFDDLERAVGTAAAALRRRGVAPGDRVVLMATPGPRYVAALLGVIRAGATAVPVDGAAQGDVLDRVVSATSPRRVIDPDDLLDDVANASAAASPEPAPGHDAPVDALLAATSGTSGAPKFVRITRGNLAFQAAALSQVLECTPDDVFLSVLPPHHLLELTGGLLAALSGGAHVHFLRSSLPHEIVDGLRASRATRLVLVPFLLSLLHRAASRDPALLDGVVPSRGGALRHVVCGGAPLAREVEDACAAAGLVVLQGYGLTEASPVVTVNTPTTRRAGTVGRPLPGARVWITADGEVVTRGPHVAAGYLGAASGAVRFDAYGTLYTADTGHLDADGFLTLSRRIGDRIVLTTGRNVEPEPVEATLRAAPGAIDLCVVAVGDAGRPRVAVVVVAQTEADVAALGTALSARARSLEPHERPVVGYLHAEALPRTATGKLRRRDVAHWAQGREPSWTW